MTATPIPRTLVLTHFGDMSVSLITGKPRDRQPIDTAVLPAGEDDLRRRAPAAQARRRGTGLLGDAGTVEESETLDVISAEDRFAELRKIFGDRVALVHGRMSAAQKEEAMGRFQRGDAGIFVATTVIEVGVDVPNATIMIIAMPSTAWRSCTKAPRPRRARRAAFGLPGCSIASRLSDTAQVRLETIRGTQDGFEIAERDLELRGEGDLLGTRQSGMPGYNLAVADAHRHQLEYAHDDARALLARDPDLAGPKVRRADAALPVQVGSGAADAAGGLVSLCTVLRADV